MSEETSTPNLPVQWDEEMAKYAKEAAAQERPPVGKISLQAGVMQYQGVALPNNSLECIVIATAFERRFDTKPFDAMNISPPDCFSLSLDGVDMKPNEGVPEPCADACAECPNNKWQPNPRKPGKNHKPCKERRRLILLPASCLQEGNIRGAELAMLTVPVTSLRHWGGYVNQVAAEFRRPPWGVLTLVSISPNPKTQFDVKFKAMRTIDEKFLGDIHSRIGSGNEVALQPWDVIPMTPESALPDQPETKRKFDK